MGRVLKSMVFYCSPRMAYRGAVICRALTSIVVSNLRHYFTKWRACPRTYPDRIRRRKPRKFGFIVSTFFSVREFR